MSSSASERTPLITVVQVSRPPPRYPHSTLRRICTYSLTALLVLTLTAATILFWFVPPCSQRHRDSHHFQPCLPKHPFFKDDSINTLHSKKGVSYEELQEILAATPEEAKAREWSQYYTSGPHLAGKNLSQAIWTKEKWESWGVKSEIVSYDIYVNYPLGHRLALLENKSNSSSKKSANWTVKYEAKLVEDVLEEDPTTGLQESIPTFHGYSANGNVTAQYVYVNYGTYWDFEDLIKANVSLKGKIALAKYGGVFRGLKVKRAQELGMIGTVIYSDPGDDGVVNEHNNKTYPDGPARNPSSVQRGSTQFLSVAPGDPTTPGYPSKPGCPRAPVDHAIPSIPSIPISYLDALPLLQALNGYGPKASSFNKYWQGGGLHDKNVSYNIGPSPPHVHLHLVNEQDYVTTPMWNVIGVINGTLPDEAVILGNHRDAWIAGGAGDPNSGSAALNEVIRSFGVALEQGWKPLRTIVFASWDGEEYGLIGSTEWVEEFLPWLQAGVVAYLNMDVGTSGPQFEVRSNPLLNRAILSTAELVLSPNQTVPGQTVGDVWKAVSNKHIAVMGSGSDFTAFQDFAGITSLDLGFGPSKESAVYHYHSNYDSFAWMERFGDPGWHYHVTAARLLGLLAAKIADEPVIAFNATDYADALAGYTKSVKAKAEKYNNETGTAEGNSGKLPTSFQKLEKAIAHLQNASIHQDAAAAAIRDEIKENPLPWWKWWEKLKLFYKLKAVNTKYKLLDRALLYEPGLDSREWFKHVVYAPGLWTGYAGATFPGLVEAIEAGNKMNIHRWEGIIAGLVHKAAEGLEK